MSGGVLTLGSLFDGIGGFPLAARMLGMRPVWASEIEPAAVMVTRRHFPEMLHLGDVTQLHGGGLPPVDIVTFGSPCQDFSIAGKGDGLDGGRSSLLHHAVRIIQEMREATGGKYPAYFVWENVPGAFSTPKHDKGEDFRRVLESFANIAGEGVHVPRPGRWRNAGSIMGDGWSLAWRVLDAQYWGVPQRRRRIFLVGHLGGGRAGQILFKPESVPRYPVPGGEARQGAAPAARPGVAAAGFDPQQITSAGNRASVDFAAPQPTLCGRGRPHALTAAFYAGQGANAGGIAYSESAAPTLKAGASGTNLAPCTLRQAAAVWPTVNGTLCARHDSSPRPAQINNAVAIRMEAKTYQEVTGTLSCGAHGGGFNGQDAYSDLLVAGSDTLVRKLTPMECERLQGFPDGWTRYGVDAGGHLKEIADTPRYRMAGNSVAIPCVLRVLGGTQESAGEEGKP